jgi:hypothetical protein
MSQSKQQSGRAYLTTAFHATRLPILTNRYMLTTQMKYSINSQNPTITQRENTINK